MNEIDVVVDVRQSPDTGELIVLKQKVAFSGDASLVGAPVETRVGLMNGSAVGRVGGEDIRLFLVRSGIVIHRRAEPQFATLPESDRLTVIKAVAPLRGMERDRWPTAGAQPLDGNPLTFAVRAGDELVVVVNQTADKGVEIEDIVHRAALEQFAKASQSEGAKP